jgi:hypothetical protein
MSDIGMLSKEIIAIRNQIRDAARILTGLSKSDRKLLGEDFERLQAALQETIDAVEAVSADLVNRAPRR